MGQIVTPKSSHSNLTGLLNGKFLEDHARLENRAKELIIGGFDGGINAEVFSKLGKSDPKISGIAMGLLSSELGIYYEEYGKKFIASFTKTQISSIGDYLSKSIKSPVRELSLGAAQLMYTLSRYDLGIKSKFDKALNEQPTKSDAQLLFKNCGVYHFARYPTEVLYSAADTSPLDNNEKLILISNPNSDWNNAFLYTKSISQIFGFFNKARVKIVESGTEKQLTERTERLKKNYGQADLSLIGGHGDPTGFELGSEKSEKKSNNNFFTSIFGNQDDPQWVVDTADTNVIKHLASLTKKTGAVIFRSCSLGKGSNSFAEVFSKTYQGKVFAATQDGGIDFIDNVNGRTHVYYSEGMMTRLFQNGRILREENITKRPKLRTDYGF